MTLNTESPMGGQLLAPAASPPPPPPPPPPPKENQEADEDERPAWYKNEKILGSGISASVLIVALFALAANYHINQTANSLNILVLILGLAVGWLLGIYFAPYSPKEEEQFNGYAKALGLFASGYLVGKIDKVIERLFDPDFIIDPTNGFRLLVFFSALLIGFIITFVFRRYA